VTCKKIMDFEEQFLKKEKPFFNVGDTVKVYTKIIEGNKERVQLYSGLVIAKKGSGLSETFTVYRSAYGTAMERVFLLNSPRVTKVVVEKQGKVRRAKLNFIKGTSGKKAKVKENLYKAENTIVNSLESEIKE